MTKIDIPGFAPVYFVSYSAFSFFASASTEVSPSAATPSTGRLYYVQLFYSRVPADAEQKKAESKLGKITRYTHNGLYKYCAGGFTSKADADALVHKAKKEGYTSAFVIALKDGQRTDL